MGVDLDTADRQHLYAYAIKAPASTCHVVSLSCHRIKTLKKLLQTMISSVLDNNNDDVDAEEEGEEDAQQGAFTPFDHKGTRQMASHDPAILVEWFQPKTVAEDYQLIVLLEDVESLPHDMLDPFVCICQELRQSVPLQLVLGVSSTADSVVRTLQHATMQQLTLGYFDARTSEQCMDALLEEVLVNDDLFRLGEDVYRFILDRFTLYDMSVTTFLHKLKYAVMDYYYANPVSVLLFGDPLEEAPPSHEHAEWIRSLPSFQAWIHVLMGSEQRAKVKALLIHDTEVFQALGEWKIKYHHYCQQFKCAYHVLRHVQDALLSVTRPTRILLLYILQGKLETTEFFQELMLVLGTLSPKQTGEMNASVRAILQQHGQDASWTPTVNVPSVYAAYFRRMLQSYTSLTGHELFYYANVQLLQQTFHPPHVPSIHTALVHPSHYLQCTCCNSTLSAKLPDVSIAFRLYLECSKFINLQDWFEAFSSVLERTSTPPSKADRAQRFCRAVIEMEWLGMIKSTSRRADHVMRILWDIE